MSASAKWAHIGLGLLFASLWLSGPLAFTKATFGKEPWAYMPDKSAARRTEIESATAEDRPVLIILAAQDEALFQRKMRDARIFIVLGPILFLSALMIFVRFIALKREDRGLHIVGFLICVAVLLYGAYTKDVPFGSP